MGAAPQVSYKMADGKWYRMRTEKWQMSDWMDIRRPGLAKLLKKKIKNMMWVAWHPWIVWIRSFRGLQRSSELKAQLPIYSTYIYARCRGGDIEGLEY